MNVLISRRLMYQERGFSLIELLIVVTLIAVIAAGVSIAVGQRHSTDKALSKVGARLLLQMRYAQDDALIQQQVIGWQIGEADHSYHWLRYDQDSHRWQTLGGELQDTQLPEGMRIDWQGDQALQEALALAALNQEDAEKIPAIVFYPDGEISSFNLALLLEKTQRSYRIVLDEKGQLQHE